MDSESRSERLKAIEDMDLASQQKEIIKALIELTDLVERLEHKFGEKK